MTAAAKLALEIGLQGSSYERKVYKSEQTKMDAPFRIRVLCSESGSFCRRQPSRFIPGAAVRRPGATGKCRSATTVKILAFTITAGKDGWRSSWRGVLRLDRRKLFAAATSKSSAKSGRKPEAAFLCQSNIFTQSNANHAKRERRIT